MFEPKPLEKSAKKVQDYSGKSKLRKLLDPLNFMVVPIERAYELIIPVPVIGPIVRANVKVLTAVLAVLLIAAALITIVAGGAVFATWISDIAGPSDGI